MKLSVIIPAFNAEETIGDALQSVQDQTFAPYEVIVVDDGSEDRTLEVASNYEELPLLLLHQENEGLGSARNRGMEAASGDAWVFLDADDAWLPQKLAAAAAALEAYPQSQWFYTPILEWTEQGLTKRSCPAISSVEDFIAYNPIVPSTVVMRSTLDFAWEEDRSLQEDVGAYLRLFAEGIFPRRINSRHTMYRLDHGMTQDLEAHYAKVFGAVDKAVELGHMNETQYQLYVVRKAYEAVRTFKKRGDKQNQVIWKQKLTTAAKKVSLPLGLRLRILFFA